VTDIFFYFTAAFGVILFGISKGGFAGPASILAIPVMSLSMSPLKAAGILLPILLIMDFLAIYFYWNKWDIKNVKIIVPPALIGIFIGGITFQITSPDSIRILVGIICLLFISISLFKKTTFIFEPTNFKGRFWSLISGYTSCVIHAGGQPLSFYLLPQKLNKTIYVGTMTLAFLIVNLVKLVPYYFLDLLIISNLKISLLLSPLAPISIYLGYYLHKKFNEETFYIIIYFFLAISGIKLIYDGFF